jgi:two-component system, LytTR family, sensor kinase
MEVNSDVNDKVLRIFLILGLFMMVWVMNLVLFRYGFLNVTIFSYSLLNFIVVFITYYTLSKIITSIRNPLKWIVFVIAFVLLSVLARYILSIPFKYMVILYPDDTLLHHLDKTYRIYAIKDLFDPYIRFFLMNRLYIHLILFFVAFMVLKYTETLKNISELSVINANHELGLLKSQIHPHFLFNTLNNLYRLVMNNEKAGEVVLKLSETLRFTLYESITEVIALKKEIKFLQNYIELEKINHGSYVNICYDFKEIENDESIIAPMLLISFVENALKHGVNEYMDKSWIEIKLSQFKHTLLFEIRNSIPIKQNPSTFQVHDLSNIYKRLDILYPNKYVLEIQEGKGYCKVNLTLHLK